MAVSIKLYKEEVNALMAPIYTKTGDDGMTGLYTGERVQKSSLRVEAYGTVDEADAALGVARANSKKIEVQQDTEQVQRWLWLLMADVASLNSAATVTEDHVFRLEQLIDKYDSQLQPLTKFLIPGDTPTGALFDLSRAVVRRAERVLWRLSEVESVHEVDIRFLNRLSDLCFIFSRAEQEL